MQVVLFLLSIAEVAVTAKPEKRSGFDRGPGGRAEAGGGGGKGGQGRARTFSCSDGGGPAGKCLRVGGRPVGGLPG